MSKLMAMSKIYKEENEFLNVEISLGKNQESLKETIKKKSAFLIYCFKQKIELSFHEVSLSDVHVSRRGY